MRLEATGKAAEASRRMDCSPPSGKRCRRASAAGVRSGRPKCNIARRLATRGRPLGKPGKPRATPGRKRCQVCASAWARFGKGTVPILPGLRSKIGLSPLPRPTASRQLGDASPPFAPADDWRCRRADHDPREVSPIALTGPFAQPEAAGFRSKDGINGVVLGELWGSCVHRTWLAASLGPPLAELCLGCRRGTGVLSNSARPPRSRSRGFSPMLVRQLRPLTMIAGRRAWRSRSLVGLGSCARLAAAGRLRRGRARRTIQCGRRHHHRRRSQAR